MKRVFLLALILIGKVAHGYGLNMRPVPTPLAPHSDSCRGVYVNSDILSNGTLYTDKDGVKKLVSLVKIPDIDGKKPSLVRVVTTLWYDPKKLAWCVQDTDTEVIDNGDGEE